MLLVPTFNELLRLPINPKATFKDHKLGRRTKHKHTKNQKLEIQGIDAGNNYYSSNSNETYKLLKQLGSGQFCVVWLVKSIRTGEVFAMKILKSEFTDIGFEEMNYFNQLNENDDTNTIVKLYDYLMIKKGANTHLCLVLEYLDNNLLEMVHKLSLNNVKCITIQLLKAVHHMHNKGLIHTDLKPENILITKGLVKVTDFGNVTPVNRHNSNHIQTRQYRAPEILLDHEWGCGVDIWSVGCIVFELITGDYLFDPNVGDSFTKDEDHLAQVIELLGTFPDPEYLVNCNKVVEYFELNDTHLEFKNIKNLKLWSLEQVLKQKYKINDKLLVDFLLKCLEFDISKRYDAGSLLMHPWLSNSGEINNRNYKIKGFDRLFS